MWSLGTVDSPQLLNTFVGEKSLQENCRRKTFYDTKRERTEKMPSSYVSLLVFWLKW